MGTVAIRLPVLHRRSTGRPVSVEGRAGEKHRRGLPLLDTRLLASLPSGFLIDPVGSKCDHHMSRCLHSDSTSSRAPVCGLSQKRLFVTPTVCRGSKQTSHELKGSSLNDSRCQSRRKVAHALILNSHCRDEWTKSFMDDMIHVLDIGQEWNIAGP